MTTLNANLLGEITTEEVALAAVRKRGWMLDYVPENLRTPEVCLEAVRRLMMCLRGS